MKRFSLTTFPLENKTVLVRVDYNVPIEEGRVSDDTRIRATLPTIRFLQQKNCKLILATHLGRPDGKVVPELKLEPIAKKLKELLQTKKIIKLNDCLGKESKTKIERGKEKDIFLLENLRFYKEEKENNPIFAHSLANLAEIYINEAFAVSHRKHASVDAITNFLPSIAGPLLEKEITNLNKALEPIHPSVWLMGGAKLDKVDLIEQALQKADYILIGGALAFAFLKAKMISVGMSKVDAASVDTARKILQKSSSKKIILPVDFVTGNEFSMMADTEVVPFNQIKSHQIALDIGPESVKLFKTYLRKAHTIVWNGPLGKFEWAKFAAATRELGRFIGKLTAISICGGGETAKAIKKFHLQDLTHVSTGGGASLMFLSGKKLPGIEALEKNYKEFSGKW